MGKRNYVEILSVRTPAGIENNYQDIVGMVLPITGNAYHGIKVVTPNGTERDIFHYNTKINPKTHYLLKGERHERSKPDRPHSQRLRQRLFYSRVRQHG